MTNLAVRKNNLFPVLPKFESLFDDFMRDFDLDNRKYYTSQLFGPVAHARREEDKLVLELDVPGVKKEDIRVALQEGRLSVSWTKKDQNFSHTEYVGDVVEPKAHVEDGVLTVTLRIPQAERVEIPVE